MEKFDIFTLTLASSAISCLLVLILLHTRRIRQTSPGLTEWTASMACWAVGSFLGIAYNTSLASLVSKILGNGAILLHAVFMYDGLMRFYGVSRGRLGRPLNLCLGGLALLGIAYFTFVAPNISGRVVVLYTLLIFFLLRCMLEPLLLREGRSHSAQWFLSAAWFSLVTLLVIRLVEHALRPMPDQSFVEAMARGVPLQAVIFLTLLVETVQAYGFLALLAGRTEAELHHAREKEQELALAQRRFLDMVSHDFKTPLAVISRCTQMVALTANARDKSVLDRCRVIEESVRNLNRLLNACLGNEALTSGELPLRLDSFGLEELLDDLRRDFSEALPGRSLCFHLPDTACVMRGDRRLLYHLLANLLDNAVKYSPEHSPVEVVLERAGGAWRISVADQGIGILEDDIERLADRGFRGGNAPPDGGTGLGLNTARFITRLHGGQLHFKSGAGSTIVTVLLPA